MNNRKTIAFILCLAIFGHLGSKISLTSQFRVWSRLWRHGAWTLPEDPRTFLLDVRRLEYFVSTDLIKVWIFLTCGIEMLYLVSVTSVFQHTGRKNEQKTTQFGSCHCPFLWGLDSNADGDYTKSGSLFLGNKRKVAEPFLPQSIWNLRVRTAAVAAYAPENLTTSEIRGVLPVQGGCHHDMSHDNCLRHVSIEFSDQIIYWYYIYPQNHPTVDK